MTLRTTPGFLGTEASLLADLTLLAYLLILLPLMALGFIFARRGQFEPQHKLVMTGITLFNWLLIGLVMFSSFTGAVAPRIPDELGQPAIAVPALHALTGLLAQLIATYLVLRMWLERWLPGWLKVRRIKLYMRLTLTLWVVTALLGIVLYVTWYGGTTRAEADVAEPVATEESAAIEGPVATEELQPAATEEPGGD